MWCDFVGVVIDEAKKRECEKLGSWKFMTEIDMKREDNERHQLIHSKMPKMNKILTTDSFAWLMFFKWVKEL